MADQSSEVDKKISKQMSSLIELLTTSGKSQLNPEIMKKFKKICRTSDVYVQHAFDLLLMQLTKNHSEIRLSTFQMVDELFNRSHAFRVLVIENFQTILELTVGTDSSLPIPPPKPAAKTMKTETCRGVQRWYEKFKDGYKKLALGYEFLKSDKKTNFEEVIEQLEQERQIEEENKRKIEQARKDKLEKVEKEMNDGLSDIQLVVTEVENGLELLMPHPDNFFIGSALSPAGPGSESQPSKSDQLENSVETRKFNKGETVVKQYGDIDHSEDQELRNYTDLGSGSTYSIEITNSDLPHKNTKGQLNTDIRETNGAKNQVLEGQGLNCDPIGGNIEKDKSDVSENNVKADDSSNNGNRSNSVIANGVSGENTAADNDVDNADYDEDNDADDDYEQYSESMRLHGGVFTQEHGLLSRTVEITVDVAAVDRRLTVNEDNADIVQDVKEKYKLIKSKYINYVKRWIQVMTDCCGKPEDIKSLDVLKSRLEEAVKKCLELDIISTITTSKSAEDSDSEDDFEDVPEKEGYEEDIPEHIKLEAFSQASTSKGRKKKSKVKEKKQYWMLPEDDDDDDDEDPNDPATILLKLKNNLDQSKGTGKSNVKVKNEPGTSKIGQKSSKSQSPTKAQKYQASKPSPSKTDKHQSPSKVVDKHITKVKGKTKEELLDKAPVKSFGVDLEHWENPEKIEAPLQVKYEGASRFWVPDKEEDESTSQEQVAALTMRTMTFTGEFEPVKWMCRAPLPDGRLCERMDRKKCPFHGKVIPRDELGQPTDPDDTEKIIQEDLQGSSDEAASSSKGKSPAKGKGKAKKRKYPNLTDITVTKNSRQRLEAKIFNKSTLKRVNQCLDAADMKKVTDKFSNQFQYSLK